MASTSDVDDVRRNTNISEDDDKWPFAVIAAYVDAIGVAGATAKLWEQKAAAYADLVDVSEAGAQERLGQLHDHALAQAELWGTKYTTETTGSAVPRARTSAIVRTLAV
jgi:hypothetical protein